MSFIESKIKDAYKLQWNIANGHLDVVFAFILESNEVLLTRAFGNGRAYAGEIAVDKHFKEFSLYDAVIYDRVLYIDSAVKIPSEQFNQLKTLDYLMQISGIIFSGRIDKFYKTQIDA